VVNIVHKCGDKIGLGRAGNGPEGGETMKDNPDITTPEKKKYKLVVLSITIR